MNEITILQRLVFEAKVQINVLAQFCNCSPSAIANYIRGASVPSGTKLIGIKEGINKYKTLINSIIME